MAYITKTGTRNNTYTVFYYSYTPDGEKMRERISGLTEDEAIAKKKELEAEQAGVKRVIFQPNIPVADFVMIFAKRIGKDHWKPKTYSFNMSLISNHITLHIGRIKIRDLTTEDILRLLETLKVTPTHRQNKYRKKGAVLSSTTRAHVFGVLKDLLNCAVEWKYIKESPMPSDKSKPSRAKPKNLFWTKNLVLEALTEIDNPLLHLCVHLLFWSSCRPGEIAGITEDCIDLKNRTILINKTLQRVEKEALDNCKPDDVYTIFPEQVSDSNSVLVLGSLKVDDTERIVHMSKELAAEVGKILVRNDQNRKHYDKYNDYGLLFAQDHGEPIEVALLAKWFRLFIKRSDGKYPQLQLKNFRHSSATYKLGLDQNIKTISATTGHKNPTVLLKHYAQTMDQNVMRLMEKMEADLYSRDEDLVEEQSTNAVEIIQRALKDEMLRNQLIAALLAGNAGVTSNA